MAELSEHAVETAVRLARAVVDGTDGADDRLTSHVAQYGYVHRIREDEDGPVLVCYPAAWLDDGVLDRSAIDSLADAIERPLYPVTPDDWTIVDQHNRAAATAVEASYGLVHGENAAAFGAYMSNHHARRVEKATRADVESFLAEYYPRNAWPAAEARSVVEESVSLTIVVADRVN